MEIVKKPGSRRMGLRSFIVKGVKNISIGHIEIRHMKGQ
jgi:hypothetical protein